MDLVLKYAPKWKTVATELGLRKERIECIESYHGLPERCLEVTIWKWVHSYKQKGERDKAMTPPPSFESLKSVIKKISTPQ